MAMNHRFDLSKMRTEYTGRIVGYFLAVGDGEVHLNDLIGKRIKLTYNGKIHCKCCGSLTRKSYAQGFCYNCYLTSPEAEECVLNPEKCKAHLGVARDIEYSRAHCLIPHYVYLSVTSGVKVGVTRHTQMPTRWIDQGASQAIVLAETPNRHIAGLIEVYLKNYYNDKTLWSKMLLGSVGDDIDLLSEKDKAAALLPPVMQPLVRVSSQVMHIHYPVLEYPTKPINVDLEKQPIFEGELTGIKGQYLIFGQSVLNIRRHTGYGVQLCY